MKKLIICEKPSLARSVLSAIPERSVRRNGYYETNNYFVSYAFGHLFGLADLESYFPGMESGRWTLDNLPFFPEKFNFALKKDPKTKKVDAGVKEQFGVLKQLMNSPEVSEIVHCGDADREGEVIVRLILMNGLTKKKPVKRLWLPEQTENTIRKALDDLKDDAAYDNLYQEGLARTYIDWLFGINYTRYVSIKSGSLMRVGRVVTPIVKAIYDREMQRKNFVPVKFWKPVSELTKGDVKIKLTSKEAFEYSDQDGAKAYCARLNSADLTVESVTKKTSVRAPGKLFSLSKLQGELGKKYKMSMKDSLASVQALYEGGYVTYPRTNTEYLAENEKERADKIVALLRQKGYDVKEKTGKKIFDDAKIESHSALTPTEKFPDLDKLSENDRRTYETILNRFLAVFCGTDCLVEKTEVVLDCGGIETFKVSGTVVKQKGFLVYEPQKEKDELPAFEKGETYPHDFKPEEKQTEPPKAYTLESLNEFLKNPFGKDLKKKGASESDDDEEYRQILAGVEIGTEATRTGIIENAINSGYISLKNNVYGIEPKGIAMVNALKELGVDVSIDTSVEMSKLLKRIYKNEARVSDAVGAARDEIEKGFSRKDSSLSEQSKFQDHNNKNEIGTCPCCGSPVLEGKMNFYCTNKGCSMRLWKSSRYFDAIGAGTMTAKKAAAFLKNGKCLYKNLKSKAGKTYDAYIVADFTKTPVGFSMEFKNDGRKKK